MTVTQLSPGETNSSLFNMASLSQTNLINAVGNPVLVEQNVAHQTGNL